MMNATDVPQAVFDELTDAANEQDPATAILAVLDKYGAEPFYADLVAKAKALHAVKSGQVNLGV